MCLGVPGRVVQLLENNMAAVDVNGNQVDISVRLIPEVKLDDYVLIHAGFAMEIIDEEIAQETLYWLKELQPNDM
jgi:hydrogenase expression/formation protein HypC